MPDSIPQFTCSPTQTHAVLPASAPALGLRKRSGAHLRLPSGYRKRSLRCACFVRDRHAGLSLLIGIIGLLAGFSFPEVSAEEPLRDATSARLPNILWISCEDMCPHLGCYGFEQAYTPNLDQLARQGARFERAFTPAGVCAVVRSAIITGTYSVAIGSQHMRSQIIPDSEVRCFTEYLREAGYFCTNRSKTDYQFAPPLTAWDRQGNQHQDWRERGPGQPFFSVINLNTTHESQVRHGEAFHRRQMESLDARASHDADRLASTLPPYFPDTPAVRRDWAWYHDNISAMDHEVGQILQRLEDDGLAESTIVVFWSDHGQGLPRGKRWLYDSGTRIAMLVRWPGQIEAGSVRTDLVSALDLPATMLALAGIERPSYFDGRVFLGTETQTAPEYLFQHRDRMDEALDMSRAVRSARFRYIRNFEPQRSYAQGLRYMDLMPTMSEWRRLAAEQKLTPVQQFWFQVPKPTEEFYDLEADPHEIHNLIDDPSFASPIATLREALEAWQERVNDQGMIPEAVQMERLEANHPEPKTRAPVWRFETREGRVFAHLECSTPGASIAYRTPSDSPGHWRLYAEPFEVTAGQKVSAIACRIGYENSPRMDEEVPAR